MEKRFFSIKTMFLLPFLAITTGLVAQSDKTLYNEIAHMDSVLFNAYNIQDTLMMKNLFTEDLEWYQDNGGLLSYQTVMSNFKSIFDRYKTLNTPIRRDLVAGSLEVIPIQNYGAIHIGKHTFCHWENGRNDCGTYRFLMIWRKTDGAWKISRVVSYDH
ncbi:MAG: nuclear transport factor 2 family protein [Saprospiraceae bacterium]|nr:nuclear transport factor 2 family protein [Saprospiraceae bacterium]